MSVSLSEELLQKAVFSLQFTLYTEELCIYYIFFNSPLHLEAPLLYFVKMETVWVTKQTRRRTLLNGKSNCKLVESNDLSYL